MRERITSVAKIVFEYTFCPAVLVACVAGSWYARAHGIGWMRTLFFSSLAPVLLITVFEYLYPYRADWNYPFRTQPRAAAKELLKDILYFVVITRIHSWLLPSILPYLVPTARGVGRTLGVYGALSAVHPALRVAIILVVGELFWYWGHRLQHHSEPFWRFHSTHHVPERLSAMKASRNHPADMLFLTIIGYLPLVALGVRSRDVMWAALIQSVVNITSHANVRVRGGAYGWLFATPDYHRVHHSEDIEESRSNYGCRLLLWDRVFGTFRPRAVRGDAVRVGVAPLGERSLKQELLDPFYRRVGA